MEADSPEAFLFLPSVGSWLIVPTSGRRRLLAAEAKAFVAPSACKLADAPSARKPAPPVKRFETLPSVGTWLLPLPSLLSVLDATAAPKAPAAAVAASTPAPAPAPAAPLAAPAPAAAREAGGGAPAASKASSPQRSSPSAEPGGSPPKSYAPSPVGARAQTTPQPAASGSSLGSSPMSTPSPKGGLKPSSQGPGGAGLGARNLQSDGNKREFRVVVPKPYPGVQYRKSRNLNDRWPRYAQNDAIVRGELEENGEWLKLEENIFLPMRVGTISILQPHVPGDGGKAPHGSAAAIGTSGAATMSAAPSGAAAMASEATAMASQRTEAAPWWACCNVCHHTDTADTEVRVPSSDIRQRGGNGGRGSNFE